MIHESGNPHDASAIGSGRIGPELPDQLAHHQLGLFLAETLNLPRNLPMVRRRVDQVIRFWDVFASLEMLDGLCPVVVEVEVEMPDYGNIAACPPASSLGQGVHGNEDIGSHSVSIA